MNSKIEGVAALPYDLRERRPWCELLFNIDRLHPLRLGTYRRASATSVRKQGASVNIIN